MRFEFSNLNTQYNSMEAISTIAKENADAARSNISSVYEASDMDIDAAVISISDDGYSRINAMLNKSIKLCTNAAANTLSPADRMSTATELNRIRIELDTLQDVDAEQMVEDSSNNILKYASESIKTQNSNRESVLQLL